jgi:integrase
MVSKITVDECQDCINIAKDKGCSFSVIKKIYSHLNSYFKYKAPIIGNNPMIGVSKPNKNNVKPVKEHKYLSKEQVKAIQDVIYNGYTPKCKTRELKDDDGNKFRNEYDMKHTEHYQAIAFDFLLQTGLRASELCGLKYSDWNEAKRELTIESNRTVANARDSQGNIKARTAEDRTPKTKESSSTLSLSVKANNILAEMKATEAKGYEGYVVHTEDGQPITISVLRGRWHRILRAAGIEERSGMKEERDKKNKQKKKYAKETFGLHTTRHTYASFLYEQYHDMQLVSKKLRHKDPALTARTYVDIMTDRIKTVDEEFEV